MQPMAPQGAPAQMQPMAPQGAPAQMQPMAPQGAPAQMQPMAPQGAPAPMQPMAPQGAPVPMQPMAPQGAPVPMYVPMNAPVNPQMSEQNTEKPAKKKNVGLIALLIAALAVGAIIIAVLVLPSVFSLKEPNALIVADIDENGDAHFVYGKGKSLTAYGEIESGFMTADRSKIVILEETGRLYWQNVGGFNDDKTTIYVGATDEYINFEYVFSNDFLIYAVDDKIYRYEYAEDESVLVVDLLKSKYSDLAVSEGYYNSDDVSFGIVEKGKISILYPDSNEYITVKDYSMSAKIDLHSISDDGKFLLWSVTENGSTKLMFMHEGAEYEVQSVNVETDFEMSVTSDGKRAVIYGGTLTAYYSGGEVTAVKFTNGVSHVAVDRKGYFAYVSTVNSSKTALYYVDFATGEKHSVITGAEHVVMYGDLVIYEDASGDISCANFDLNSFELVNENIIGRNVQGIYYPAKGGSDYLYYTTYASETYTLYAYDLTTGEDVFVARGVRDVKVSTCGRYVYYLTDLSAFSIYGRYGDLMVYDAKKGESELIASDVLSGLTSGLFSGDIDPKSFFFRTFESNSADGYEYDVCYYNGREWECVLDNIET